MVASEFRPKISVTVPTYNRAETLRRTLAHLANQELDAADYEVVIVDDGSSDGTRALVEHWMEKAPCHVQYIQQSNHGPGYSYNRAFEAAKAPVVLLIADDILLSPQALTEHVAMHQLHPQEEIAVFGRTEISPELQVCFCAILIASAAVTSMAPGTPLVSFLGLQYFREKRLRVTARGHA